MDSNYGMGNLLRAFMASEYFPPAMNARSDFLPASIPHATLGNRFPQRLNMLTIQCNCVFNLGANLCLALVSRYTAYSLYFVTIGENL